MTFELLTNGQSRKQLAQAIAEYMECDVKYLGAPTFAYEVDYFTVNKNGSIVFDGRADTEEIEGLIDFLVYKDFIISASYEEGTEDEETEDDSEDREGIAVQLPVEDITPAALDNLYKLIDSKAELIKKAVGCDSVNINLTEDGRLEFPWFARESTPEEVQTYMLFVKKLVETAKAQKRVTAKQKEVENEKFAFRCFLLKLGFIGDEYKLARKILLKNFEGSSAFKSAPLKKYRVELDDDNFKVFSAKNDDEANLIAWRIAEEQGSNFCELHKEED